MSILARASRLVSASGPVLSRYPARLSPSLWRGLSSAVFPDELKYKKSHEWVKVDGDIATVGISNHAQAALGEIVFADLPDIGRTVAAAEPTAALESVKAAAEVYAPVSGEIVGVNDKLSDSPELINSNPHDEGWMFQVKLADPSELDGLMDAQAYATTLEGQ